MTSSSPLAVKGTATDHANVGTAPPSPYLCRTSLAAVKSKIAEPWGAGLGSHECHTRLSLDGFGTSMCDYGMSSQLTNISTPRTTRTRRRVITKQTLALQALSSSAHQDCSAEAKKRRFQSFSQNGQISYSRTHSIISSWMGSPSPSSNHATLESASTLM